MDFSLENLRDAERHVVEKTACGEIADFTNIPEAIIRAGLIQALLIGLPQQGGMSDPPFPVRLAGLRIKGARIEGEINLHACRGVSDRGLPGLSLEHCDVPDRIDLRGARIARLSLKESRTGKILAESVHMDGPFDFSHIKPYDQNVGTWINARASVIHGEVIGVGATLVTPQRTADSKPWNRWYALRLSESQIGGMLNLRGSFSADGGVTISAAQINGDVWLAGAKLMAGESRAMNARNAHITGLVMMIDGFHAVGEVSFQEAVVHGRLSCTDGATEGTPVSGVTRGRKKRALLRIDGTLDLRGADFRGSVELGGGVFNHANHWAINAAGIRVGGDFRLRPHADSGLKPSEERDQEPLAAPTDPDLDSTYVIGGVRLEGAHVRGELIWDKLFLEGPGPESHARPQDRRAVGRKRAREAEAANAPRIKLADAHIGNALKAYSLHIVFEHKSRVDAVIDLTGLNCAILDDDLESDAWGQKQASVWLMLQGFTYRQLSPDVKFDPPQRSDTDRWRRRKKWFKRHFEQFKSFHPQPYQLLAAFYRNTGWISDYHHCLRHEQWLHLRHESHGLYFTHPLSLLFGVLAGFGHSVFRLWITLLLYLALGYGGVELMSKQGLLIVDTAYVAQLERATGTITNARQAQAIRCDGEITPWLYALDVMVPLDLREENKCEPGFVDGDHGRGGELFLLRALKAAYALIGALLSGGAVLIMSGAMRGRQET